MTQKKLNVKERLNNDGEIDLSMLQIQEVPVKEIASLKKGTTLNLYNNSISKLPKNFATLTHIVKLDLSKNCLTELPDNFGDLVKLKHLDLYQNQLVRLPLSFSNLKALKWLDLKENPLETTLSKVAGPCENTKQCQTCARNIINYLSRQQKKADAEREEKEKQKKKQAELNEQRKKEEKKLRKIENSEVQKNGTPHVLTKTEKKKIKKLKKQSEVKTSGGFSSLLVVLLLLVSLFILTSIQFKYFVKLESFVSDVYFKLIGMLPESYRTYGNVFAHNFKQIHMKTGEHVLNCIDFLQNNEQCLLIYRLCKNLLSSLWINIQSLYQKIIS